MVGLVLVAVEVIVVVVVPEVVSDVELMGVADVFVDDVESGTHPGCIHSQSTPKKETNMLSFTWIPASSQ